jgi:hypothetical protein
MRGAVWTTALLMATAAIAAAVSDRRLAEQPTPAGFADVLDEHPAIQYAQRPTRDRVSLLSQAIAQGSVSLPFDAAGGGYLRALLTQLGISAESQILVFSKTGIQSAATSPQNPRALYFDDSVVVGYIAGARYLEVAAHDPEQGVVFYTIDQKIKTRPTIERNAACLTCHVSSITLEVPGLITRSNFMSADGSVIPQLGFHTVDHRTPLPQRWGGWYVTGNYVSPPYGGIGHMGNVTTTIHPISGPVSTSNEIFIDWINSSPERRGYPSADSDIAALMVFDHQVRAVNLLTRLNWASRVAASAGAPNFAAGALRELVDELTDYLLFVDEISPPARLTPRPGFARDFMAAAPMDHHGRSLRQLDLENRLVRYPCSYMVYSRAFDNLPVPARNAVYQRMWTILSGADTSRKYAHLSAADRRAVVEILSDTKKDLPESFRAGGTEVPPSTFPQKH